MTVKRVAFVVLGLGWAVQASAQTPATTDPNPGRMTLTGSFDTVSTYMFRGIRQNSELAGVDHTFGFFSIAGIVTVPLGGTTGFGAWNVHGGVEYQALGETTEAFDGGDSSRVIGSIGFGFTY